MDKIQNYTNSYKYQSTVGFKAGNSAAQTPAVQIPDLYYFDANITTLPGEKKRKINPFLEMWLEMFGITPWIENPLVMAPVTAATLYGIGKFSDSFSGEYGKSCVGKAAKFGDKIGSSRFMQSNAIQTIKNKTCDGARAIKKFLCKNDAMRAMFETPSIPEWNMPKHEMTPAKQRFLDNFNRITATLGINTSEVRGGLTSNLMGDQNVADKLSLETIGLDKAEKDIIKGKYNTLNYSKIPEADRPELINRFLLNRLKTELPELTEEKINEIISSSDATKQVQDKICEALHLTREEIEEISKDTTGKYVDKVRDALGKMKNKDAVRIGAGRYNYLPSRFQPLERKITTSSVYNNLYSISDGAKTLTGKFMARATQIAHSCMTFGGGKLGVLILIAPTFYRAIMNTHKADKDQKVGTLANGVVTGVSWIITFPLAMKLMHAVGGMNYAGMTKDEVQTYRDELKKLQEANEAGKFATRKEYKDAAKKVLDIKKNAPGLKNQSLITKIGKGLGSFLEIGNENPKGWNNPKSLKLIKWFRKKNFHRKDLIGAPLRFVLFIAVFQKLLDGIIEKGVEKAFGKHYDEMSAEEQLEKKKEQEKYSKEDLKKRMLEIQAKKQGVNIDGTPIQSSQQIDQQQLTNIQATQSAQAFNSHSSNENNVVQQQVPNEAQQAMLQQNTDEVQNQQDTVVDNYSHIPSAKNNIKEPVKKDAQQHRYIPSQDSVFHDEMEKKEEQKGGYIPSQMAAKINTTYDNSGLNAALNRADRAEQQALDILAGKFDNI